MINGKIIKVCGMSDAENIRQVEESGVDMIGFIFYPNSPRYVKDVPRYLPERAMRVGVFVDEEAEKVEALVREFKLEYVQLHGSESPGYCRSLLNKGIRSVKAFPVAGIEDLDKAAHYEGVCNYFLFDTKCGQYGGSGCRFDWSMLRLYRGNTPFLLSGGISPDCVEDLKEFAHPQFAGIDINSRFETAPGRKDVELIKDFLNRLI